MQGIEIVNRLKEVLGKYNSDFVDLLSVTSLSRTGTTATAVTSAAHNLTTGDYVTMSGAQEPVTINSITRVDDVVTVVTATPTNLIDPSKYDINLRKQLTVTIDGVTPSDYNGTFQLLTVSDDRLTLTYKITTTPAAATVNGFVLLNDYDGYNGYKQVTVVDSTTFTYTISDSLQTPAQGTIEAITATRVACGATSERISQYHEKDVNRVNQNWMYVLVGPEEVYKDDTTATDIETSVQTNERYFYEVYQGFSVYVFLPSNDNQGQNDILGCTASDKARTLRNLVVKALANYQFPSDLVETVYQPAVYVGSEEDDYNVAYYVHRFDFGAKGYIQPQDTMDLDPGVPLELIDGSFKDKTLTFKPAYL